MNKILRFVVVTVLFVLATLKGNAQFTFGNTGLMHLPTADMQRDKTFMAGWAWLDPAALPQAIGWDKKPTMNYYLNVTFFPWMEVSYTCTLFRGEYLSAAYGLPSLHFNKWANQDRHFDFRFRLWKEGWWKWWTPQIVIGFNDMLHTFSSGSISNILGNIGTQNTGNGYWGRQFIAATKHFEINNVGTLGVHAAYMHNSRTDFHYEGVGAGANFQFNGIHTGNIIADKVIHGLNLMGEYDTRTFNGGAQWNLELSKSKQTGLSKCEFYVVCEMNKLRHFSGGAGFKVHLK